MKQKLRLTVSIVLFSIVQVLSQIPKGQIKGPFKFYSTIYPGTERNYWMYVPAQYDASKPANCMIVQDGLSRANGWHLSEYLDTLIAEGKIPPIIGIYIDHGKVPSQDTVDYPRFNRSFEYDGLGDRYARFLIEEILPEIKKSYNISDDPNDRALAGASSGAICAFNAAWERPDAFRRVLSTIGTYVGLRGADQFHTLVRKTEPKPLRVFLEDGFRDLNIYAGDWYIANQQMFSALTWAGYEVNHAWGEGEHSNRHALTIIKDALIWLYEGYPTRISTHMDKYKGMRLVNNQDGWKEIKTSIQGISRLATNSQGEVYFISNQENGVWKLQGEAVSKLSGINNKYAAIETDDHDRLILSDETRNQIIAFDGTKSTVFVDKTVSDRLESDNKGLYFTKRNAIGYLEYTTKKVSWMHTDHTVNALCINAEHSFINVSMSDHTKGHSVEINMDGSLSNDQEFIHYHIPDGKTTANAQGGVVDTANSLYTATNMGVQITDQLGRVNMILPTPSANNSDIAWGDPDMNRLYIISDGKLYGRKINTKGLRSADAKRKPPRPGL